MEPARFAVGVDIGGTKTALAAIDPSGRILARTTLATEAALGFERAVSRLTATIDDLQDQLQRRAGDLMGIGIGCAGPLDLEAGLINNPYTLTGWDRCDIVTPLRQHYHVPVLLENDADAAALGECWLGAGRGFDPVVLLTFGTGVGGAAVVRGRIQRGVDGAHPELGHMPVLPEGPSCYCGFKGCLESVASGTAIAEAGRALGLATAEEVFAAAAAGHPSAKDIVSRAHAAAATAAWTIFHTLLPQRVILGGGIMETQFDGFAAAMRHALPGATQFPAHKTSIAPATLGNDAGLVGAAALILGANA
jgi:glucokinase